MQAWTYAISEASTKVYWNTSSRTQQKIWYPSRERAERLGFPRETIRENFPSGGFHRTDTSRWETSTWKPSATRGSQPGHTTLQTLLSGIWSLAHSNQ